jgi:hypothetical protein
MPEFFWHIYRKYSEDSRRWKYLDGHTMCNPLIIFITKALIIISTKYKLKVINIFNQIFGELIEVFCLSRVSFNG